MAPPSPVLHTTAQTSPPPTQPAARSTQPAARPHRTVTPPRRLRGVVLLLALVLMALIPLDAARPLPTWTAGFHQATCVGPCCLIMDGFFELSCGEYTPPSSAAPSTGSGPPYGAFAP
ncbi:MAG TPA: hypothetical protein VKF37_01270 [Chloroflexota bacterium]|nr:hypothetical protein [Chloroflexota bacterium]